MGLSAPLAPSGEQFEIEHGDQHAVVVEVGGGLRSYSAGGHDVLDGYAIEERADGGRGQCLIPWPNRVRDGRYEWQGEAHQLDLSEPELGNAIHGLARWRGWRALERARGSVSVGLRLFATPGYPFALDLRNDYELGERGLRVTTRARNIGPQACPYGVGFHPYLRVGDHVDDWRVRLVAERVLKLDERQIPVGSAALADTRYDFRALRAIGDAHLDTCFCELRRDADGRARVTLEGAEETVTMWLGEAYRYAMVYSGDTLALPRRRQGLAVEPMSCAPNAFQTGDGLIRLEPGETHIAEWGIEPR